MKLISRFFSYRKILIDNADLVAQRIVDEINCSLCNGRISPTPTVLP
ncbi:MAG: hypothetical protein AB9897_09680 [Anaerolineaceae bacterium]